MLCRFDGNSSVTKVHTMKVASKWITHLAFSSWTLGEPGTCEFFDISRNYTFIDHTNQVKQRWLMAHPMAPLELSE